ncbi:MAG: carboxypeptidase-like regulatory domain-containing protein [Planctomycetaceae bacterium]|nr:carboxypeptidase-like regulatory domain-containing protein [Planctomycetaceae bacterium]
MSNIMKTLTAAITLLFVTIMVSGCSQKAARVSVEGSVVFQGKPVDNATVIIRPEAGPEAGSVTDANGKFVIPKDCGPMAGKVQIMVEKFTDVQEKDHFGQTVTIPKPALPDGVQSKRIPFTLTNGRNTLKINLDE